MTPRKLRNLNLGRCAALLLVAACGPGVARRSTSVETPPARILFIGNSFTSFNGGIDKEVEGLAPSSEARRITEDGYTLEDHWNDGAPARRIREGGWAFVVLQEQSQRPIFDRESFYRF
ncbi:MAG TPA: hypothetical protein VJP78_01260, partial [Thermoleophilia bacterium]|nr:hypothetical protein [Thermoleophilia bacterium]